MKQKTLAQRRSPTYNGEEISGSITITGGRAELAQSQRRGASYSAFLVAKRWQTFAFDTR
jgi:hypothetical protein